MFHEHAELALRLDIDPGYFKTNLPCVIDGHKVEYNQEMIEHLRRGIEYIKFRMTEHGEDVPVILMVEQRVSIEDWTHEPGGFGTSDVCIIFPTLRLIIVFDWKYGKIAVSPVENDQLTLYCLGCWKSFAGEIFDWDPTDITVELTIWQPRVPGAGGTWKTTMEWVLAEGEKIKEDALATYDPLAPRTPGAKQCLYCKASADCPALAKYNLEMFSLRFDDIDDGIDYGIEPPEPDFEGWTPERKAYVQLHQKTFKRWLAKLGEQALEDAKKGQPWPLLKVIEGQPGHRYYKPDTADEVKGILVQLLGRSKAVKEVVITPAQAQDALGKRTYEKHIKPYVETPRGKATIVPETDPRPALPSIGQEFDVLMSEEDEDEDA